MAEKNAKAEGLIYKGHPLRRIDNLIYYGTMAEKYIVMMQIQDTKKVQDLNVASKVSDSPNEMSTLRISPIAGI